MNDKTACARIKADFFLWLPNTTRYNTSTRTHSEDTRFIYLIPVYMLPRRLAYGVQYSLKHHLAVIFTIASINKVYGNMSFK